MNETEKILEEALLSAPKEIQIFLANEDWLISLQQIEQKNNFSPEQKEIFENETLFVLLGLEFRGDFPKNIQSEMNLSETVSLNIARDVEIKIFREIDKFLPTGVDKTDEKETNTLSNQKLLDQAEHMLETEVVQNQRDSQINNFGTMNQTINPPTQTPVDKKLEELSAVNEEKDWQNRKEKIPDGQVIERPYKEDPYREPPVA